MLRRAYVSAFWTAVCCHPQTLAEENFVRAHMHSLSSMIRYRTNERFGVMVCSTYVQTGNRGMVYRQSELRRDEWRRYSNKLGSNT